MKQLETNEWIEVVEGIGTVGVTKAAQKELGEIVYVELPEMGKSVKEGEEVCVLESTKAAIDLYCPVSGTIVAINEALKQTTTLLNRDPESTGWLYKIRLS